MSGNNSNNSGNNLEVVNIDDFLEDLQQMSVEELVTLVNLCTQVIEDKTSSFQEIKID